MQTTENVPMPHTQTYTKKGKKPTAIAFSANDMQSFSKTGEHLPADVLAELKKIGFDVGMAVAPKSKMSEKHTIKSIGPVVIVERSGGEELQIPPQKFAQTFTKYEECWYPTSEEHQARCNEQYLRSYGRSVVSVALQGLVMSSDAPKVDRKKGFRFLMRFSSRCFISKETGSVTEPVKRTERVGVFRDNVWDFY